MTFKCVNEGDDPRLFRGLTCSLQRIFSYKDPVPPVLDRRELAPGVTLYSNDRPRQWYRVIIVKLSGGKFYHLRVGFRYDVNWGGYIFPSIAAKETTNPNP